MTYPIPLPASLPPPALSLEHSGKATKAFAISASLCRLEPAKNKAEALNKSQPAIPKAAAGKLEQAKPMQSGSSSAKGTRNACKAQEKACQPPALPPLGGKGIFLQAGVVSPFGSIAAAFYER